MTRIEPHGRHRHCGVSPRSRVDGFPRLRQHVPGFVVVRLEQGVGEVRRKRESRLVVLRQQARRTAEQRAAGVEIAAFEGSSPGRRETRGSATREPVERRIRAVELGPVPMRLLEVVADDLVALDEVVRREPLGEALVQLGSGRLRERLVGGVADEQVPEAEALVVRKGR